MKTNFDKGAAIIKEHLKTMPSSPGVYRMLGDDGCVLYVGKAKNLKKRVVSYTQPARQPNRIQRMVAQTKSMELVTTHTESEALLLEANLIQRFKPPFNVVLRDDKSYPYILITRDHDYPALAKHRGRKRRKGWYFGPFASGSAVNDTLSQLQRAFMVRNCTDTMFASRKRPCLQYHIKRCTAPCVHKVSKEDYAAQVKEAYDFLRGESQAVQSRMADEMQSASDKLEYEKAALLRDRIRMLTKIQAKQDVHVQNLGDADVIGLHQEGGHTAIQMFFFRGDKNYGTRTYFPSHDKTIETDEILAAFIGQFYAETQPPALLLINEKPKEMSLLQDVLSDKADRKVKIMVPQKDQKKRLVDQAVLNASEALGRKMAQTAEQKKLLRHVQKLFNVPHTIKRIEVYDNSHISGKHAIGAMIAAGPTGFLKKTYRKFNIKTASGQDDFGMMEEVLTRRFKRLVAEDPKKKTDIWPDLLLIDGGAGQIGKVQKVLTALNIEGVTLVGIAKGPDRNAGRERFFISGQKPFSLPIDDPTLYYLQRLRDESHRYAIGTHRAKRAKNTFKSDLDDVPGIGASRKRALLRYFGSAKAVEGAGILDLSRVDGISQALAKKIYDYFH